MSTNPNRTASKQNGPDLSKCFVPVASAEEHLEPVMPDTFQEAAPKLMLTIQSRAVAEARSLVRNMNNLTDSGFIGWPYAEHLAICVVYDTPNMQLCVTASEVDKWGVCETQLFQTAYRNLGKLPLDFRSTFKDGRVFRSFADDTYDATRLLLPTPSFGQLPVRGTHVAMVPHPNVLLITGDQDPEGLRVVLASCRKALKDPLAIGPFMFRLSNTGWEPWNPELPPADRRSLRALYSTRWNVTTLASSG